MKGKQNTGTRARQPQRTSVGKKYNEGGQKLKGNEMKLRGSRTNRGTPQKYGIEGVGKRCTYYTISAFAAKTWFKLLTRLWFCWLLISSTEKAILDTYTRQQSMPSFNNTANQLRSTKWLQALALVHLKSIQICWRPALLSSFLSQSFCSNSLYLFIYFPASNTEVVSNNKS